MGHSLGGMAAIAMAEQRPELFGRRVPGLVLVGTSSADLLRGAMGSVTELLRPRLGTFATAAQRVDRVRKAVLASPGDVRGAVVRLTQFGPDAPTLWSITSCGSPSARPRRCGPTASSS